MKNKRVAVILIMATAVIGFFLIQLTGKRSDNSPASVDDPRDPSPKGKSVICQSHGDPLEGKPVRSVIELFAGNNDVEAVWDRTTPAALRARTIVPDAALLKQQPVLKVGDVLKLPLFDDAVLETVISNVTRYPTGAVGMTARLQGEFKGTVYLSYCGGELRMHAEVWEGNDFYVRYDHGQQMHVAIEVDKTASDYLEDGMDCPEPPPSLFADQLALDEPAVAGDQPGVASDTPAGTVIVDVMIVYTPEALDYEVTTNGINNNITMAMQKANTVHGNSDSRVVLNLVHSAEVTYTEAEISGDGGPYDDLVNLTYTGGDYSAMDEVQTWRDTYKADLVCLYEYTQETGGMAWLLDSTNGVPDEAFCLARVQQADWTYTVVHEWGHNMGCGHSETQYTQKGPGLYDYASGWQWDDSGSPASDGFCSVMTYENFDGFGDYEYERVPYFSNPDIDYTGDSTNPTGDADAGDNARAIRNIRQVVSMYRINIDAGTFTLFPFNGNTHIRYQWQTASERMYSLYWARSLSNGGFSLMESNLVSGLYTDLMHSSEQTGFYKLEAQ